MALCNLSPADNRDTQNKPAWRDRTWATHTEHMCWNVCVVIVVTEKQVKRTCAYENCGRLVSDLLEKQTQLFTA